MGPLYLYIALYLGAIIHIAISAKSKSGEKLAWIVIAFIVPIFGWVFFMLLAPLKNQQEQRS